MKKRLRLLAWLITLTMLCQMLPFSAFAQSDIGQELALAVAQSLEEENGEAVATGTCGDNVTWSLSGDGVLTISGTGPMEDYDIPNQVLPAWIFYSAPKTIIINPGVTHIGNYAFMSLSGYAPLSSVTIPDSVTSIGNSAFASNENLTSIVIPDSVTFIGDFAFASSKKLTSIVIPDSVTHIGDAAFMNSGLKSVIIPDGVISIGDDAFIFCTDLAIATISKSVTSVGSSAFAGCTNLYDVTIGAVNIGPDMFSDCTNLRYLTLSDSVTSIGAGAFKNTNLGAISIPDSVISIGSGAFSDCTNLESIVLSHNITAIGDYTFGNCANLDSITIPDSVTSIGISAFKDCTSLKFISIPGSVTSIGRYAFSGCTSLSSATLSSGITCIDEYAFSDCVNLKSITIPNSITYILNSSFQNCENLKDVYYLGSETQWASMIIVRAGNEYLLNATIHYTYNPGPAPNPDPDPNPTPDPDPDPNPTPDPDPDPNPTPDPSPDPDPNPDPEPDPDPTPDPAKNGLEFGKDTLAFANSRKDFFDLSSQNENKLHYNISDEKFNLLTRNLKARVKRYIKKQKNDKWGGSCYGMAAVVFLHYLDPERIPLSSVDGTAKNVHDLKAPKDDSTVEDLINYYQLSSFLPTAYNYRADCMTRYQTQTLNEIESIVQEVKNGNPVNISIANETSAHRVVLYEFSHEDDNGYVFKIYDPVSPSSNTFLTLCYHFDTYYSSQDKCHYPKISYADPHEYKFMRSHILSSDLEFVDLRNFFGLSDYEVKSDYDKSHVSLNLLNNVSFKRGNVYFRAENGKLTEISSGMQVYRPDNGDENNLELIFDNNNSPFELTVSPDEGSDSSLDILLNDTLLSISTDGPTELTYDEQNRTVDVKSTDDTPLQVNLSFTQNEPTSSWPWHSWAIDTTDTTTLHAELDDEGLHLSGDGIANAKYATENMDTDTVDSGTIPAGAEAVTIISKNDSGSDKTEIKTDMDTPTDPDLLTVTVSGGTIIQINEEPFAGETHHSVKQGDEITIMADTTDKFTGWTVSPSDNGGTFDDATASTAIFTMGSQSVRITANYDTPTDPTPTPTPGGGGASGGGSSSGGSSGGGGGGAGAAVLIGVGAAAAITAGVVMTAPVEISGHAELSDHTALAGAKISLLQNGKVVTQTTADENGRFTLKAKRGSYELTAVYTNADGQLIHQTISIKAPAKDLVITF